MVDYFRTAFKWFLEVNRHDKRANYPYLMWNLRFRAGASIYHGHMQMVLNKYSHVPEYKKIVKAIKSYKKQGLDYFRDLFEIYEALGLFYKMEGKTLEEATYILFSLTPYKDKEIVFITDKFSDTFAISIFRCINALIKEAGLESLNMGIVFKPFLNEDNEMKIIGKIIDRQSTSLLASDISGMRIFGGIDVITDDPFLLSKNVSKYIKS